MATIISTKQRNDLKVNHLGLAFYYLLTNSNGNFQEPLDVTARNLDSTHATIHRLQKHLIALGVIEVVQKSRRGSDGYPTTPSLRLSFDTLMDLVPQGQVDLDKVIERVRHKPSPKTSADTKMDLEKLSPNGLVTDIYPSNSQQTGNADCVSTRPIDVSPITDVGMDLASTPAIPDTPQQPPELYRPGQRGIPAEGFDSRRVPLCSECRLDACDYFEHKGRVDIERFCSEDCHDSWSQQQAINEANQEKQG